MNRMKLGEILSVKHGWAFKGEYFAEDGEQSILTPGNFFEKGGFKPNNGKERYYTGTYPKEYLCHKGDLIVAMTQQAEGLLGSTALVPENNKYLHNQRIGLITCDEKRLNKLFAYYLFMTKSVREQLERSSSGTKVKHTSPEKIYDVEVEIPDVISQQKIANLLWAIDEKIANNNAINDNLEQQAKLLYDYWFTQFDFPDENGKPYRSSGGKMVWNEQLKMEIPFSWICSKMENAIEAVRTGLNPRNNFQLGNGNIQYITVKNLCLNGSLDFSGCDTIDEQARQIVHRRSDIQRDDILFASIAPLGRCYLIQENPTNWDINESVFSIRYNSSVLTAEYLYMNLQSETFVKRATACSTGSIFKGIRINSLMDSEIILPPLSVTKEFSKEIKPLFALQKELDRETHTLIQLRDWLLPMLMNGQATISD